MRSAPDAFECADCPMADPADCMKVGYCEHRDPPRTRVLLDLADRIDALKAADRDLDAEIAEVAHGWKPAPCPPDYDGKNAGEVLTPDGQPFTYEGKHWSYPPRGKIHRAYHCPEYTRNCQDWDLPRDTIRRKTSGELRAMAAGARFQQ